MNRVVDGISYDLEVYGEGIPLLLLHGFTGDKSTWYPFISNWEKGNQLILLDIIGHGKTDCPNETKVYDIHNVARHIAEILEQLHINKVNLLGYSMGGRLALAFSILYPHKVNKLILESASPGLEGELERKERRIQDNLLGDYIKKEGIKKFVEKWENIPLFASQKCLPIEQQDNIRKKRLLNSVIGLVNSLKGMGTGAQPSWWDQLLSLPEYVLVITGELDEKFCQIASRMTKKNNYIQWISIENSGHAIHVEKPEIFDTIVREFLSDGG